MNDHPCRGHTVQLMKRTVVVLRSLRMSDLPLASRSESVSVKMMLSCFCTQAGAFILGKMKETAESHLGAALRSRAHGP
eukprot:4988660-Pleurochrysis_carterae.AAC.1